MKIKITVLDVLLKKDLWAEYIAEPPQACPFFTIGDEFLIEEFAMPKGFCTWAWQDLFYVFYSLWKGGTSVPWYKEHGVSIVSCTDGLRPVTFKIERVNE